MKRMALLMLMLVEDDSDEPRDEPTGAEAEELSVVRCAKPVLARCAQLLELPKAAGGRK
jgi:hypothetical protein